MTGPELCFPVVKKLTGPLLPTTKRAIHAKERKNTYEKNKKSNFTLLNSNE